MASKRMRSISPEPASSASIPLERLYPQAGPAPSPRKPSKQRSRGPTDDQAETEPAREKRLKLYKKACPRATQDRVARVMSQRFFCVGRERTSATSEQFKVLGSTGNVYSVTIAHVPTCDCPDAQKGNLCKHILFVFLKILQVPQSVNLWYQSALLTTELEAIFANARPAPQSHLDERVKKVYRVATGLEAPQPPGTSSDAVELIKKRIPQQDDSCPICYEDFDPGSEQGLVFCLSLQGCGNPLHVECFQNWARTSTPVTCPMCREKWTQSNRVASSSSSSSAAAAGPSYSSDGYLNLAEQTGISTKRDTSSYYHGPTRRDSNWRRRRNGWDRTDSYADGYDDIDDWRYA